MKLLLVQLQYLLSEVYDSNTYV